MVEPSTDEVRRLLDGTTPGPWRPERLYRKHMERIPDQWWWAIDEPRGEVAWLPIDDEAQAEADARLVAAAPDLAAAVLALTAERDRLREAHHNVLLLAEEMARELVIHCGSGHQEQVDLFVAARAALTQEQP